MTQNRQKGIWKKGFMKGDYHYSELVLVTSNWLDFSLFLLFAIFSFLGRQWPKVTFLFGPRLSFFFLYEVLVFGPSNDPRGCIEKRHMFFTHVPGVTLEQCSLQEPCSADLATAWHLPPDFLTLVIHMGRKDGAHFADILWGGIKGLGTLGSASDHFQLKVYFRYILKQNPCLKWHPLQFKNGGKGQSLSVWVVTTHHVP